MKSLPFPGAWVICDLCNTPCLLKQTLFLVNSHPSEARKQPRVSVSSENASRPANLGLVAGVMNNKLLESFSNYLSPKSQHHWLPALFRERMPDGADLPSSFDFYQDKPLAHQCRGQEHRDHFQTSSHYTRSSSPMRHRGISATLSSPPCQLVCLT